MEEVVTNVVTRREYLQYTQKYLVPGIITLTRHGVPEYEIIVTKIVNGDKVVTKKNKVVTKVSDKVKLSDKPKTVVEGAINTKVEVEKVLAQRHYTNNFGEYGCGCKKEAGAVFCKKHNRQ